MIFNLKKIKSKVKNKIKKSKKIKKYLLTTVDNFIEQDIQNAILHFYLGRIIAFIGYQSRAEFFYRSAISIDNKKWKYHFYLAKSLTTQKKWWQVVDTLQEAIDLNNSIAELHYRLALAQVKMNNFSEAEASYAKAIELYKKHTDWMYFNYGHALQKSGKPEKAKKAFSHAITLDKNKNSLVLGIGIFYEKKAQWALALDAYKTELKENSQNALLHYKVGLSYAKSYNWKSARESLEEAVSLDNNNAYWFYKLGFVYERAQLWKEAELAYQNAIEKQEKYISNWYYRLGYVQIKQEKYKTACSSFYSMYEFSTTQTIEQKHNNPVLQYSKNYSIQQLEHIVENDYTNLTALHALAKSYEEHSYEKSEQMYRELIKRWEDFNPNLHVALGNILAIQEKYEEASFVYLQQKIMQDAYSVPYKSFRKNKNFRKLAIYTEYYEKLEIEDHIIMYESFTGNNMSENPLAIFSYLLKKKEYSHMLHIWVINDMKKIPDKYKKNKNIIFIKRASNLYLRYLCKAKYLINNSGFPPYYIKKENQKYLNTWHGTPLKTLGKEQKYKFFDHKRTQRNFLQASHIISPNPHTSKVLIESYDLKNIYTGKIAETGYPRIDNLINKTNQEKEEIKNLLGLDSDKTIVLYAPTWRGTLQDVNLDTKKLEDDINKLSQLDCQLLFRGHSLLENILSTSNLNCITVPITIDTNNLLSIVDILITDYSSIFFDFITMKKPILYYIYDLEEYEEERGLYFDMKKMPGDKCYTIDELYDNLVKAISTGSINKDEYNRSIIDYNMHDDGYATQRVVDFFFKDQDIEIVHDYSFVEKNNNVILFGGSLLPNGITTSFTNLVNLVDKNKVHPIIPFSPNTIEKSLEGREAFKKMDYSLDFIPRYGNMLMTLEERYTRFKFEKKNYQNLKGEEYKILERMYQREYKRIFGNSKVDNIINFSGYDNFWVNVLAFGGNVSTRSIYQHNDLYGEWMMKYPKLEEVFRLYSSYDKIVSVSEDTRNLNLNNLSNLFNIKKEKFIFSDNIQNIEDILTKSDENILNESDNKIFSNTKVLINIARLSPEKGQEKLIKAFAKVSKRYTSVRLIILGLGPSENNLKSLIKELKLGKKVFLLGQKLNPYPYLKASDCFILSSEHEGQPMTLFEAMILKKPIIATNIVGNKSVLEGRQGLLVENSEDGLINGMMDFLEGRYVEENIFDYTKYNNDALDMFYEKVVN